MTEASVIFALFAAGFLTLALWLSAFLTQRAMFKVIEIFCRNNALRAQNAKTIEELDLTPPDFFQRITQMRDYKPHALKILIQQGIVKTTLDGKLYLMEEKLNPDIRCNDLSVLPR
jgi:hypothetical protein